MIAIGKEVGVASNVVHWYFDTKDHLFVESLERLQESEMRELAHHTLRGEQGQAAGEIEEFMIGLIERLTPARSLITAVHDRARHSQVVAEFHERAHARYSEHLTAALTGTDLPSSDQALAIATLVAALESLVMHDTTPAAARELVQFLTNRLIPTPKKELTP